MNTRCSTCGSTEDTHVVYSSLVNEAEWKCRSCVSKRFPSGTRVVKFTDTANPYHPTYYLSVKSNADLDLIMSVSERAREIGAKGFQACFYTAHNQERLIGPMAFPLGYAGSNLRLRKHVDKLRMWMETSSILPGRVESESNLEDSKPLFAPINL